MSLAPSSFEMIARAHRVAAGFHVRVRNAVAALPGNPGRVTVARFGSLCAARCDLPGAPGWMNLMGPVSAADLPVLGDALAWYGELRPWIEVSPQPEHEKLAIELARHGAVQTAFLDILRAPLDPSSDVATPPPGVTVSVVTRDESMLFARTLLAGHGDTFYDHEAEALASLVGGEGLTCYLARCDGEPAAAAMLCIDGDIAYLANASALPAFRNRGCHTALLATRLRDAAATGSEMVIALAAVASTSHRNMERAGLQPLVTLVQWTFPPPGDRPR